MTVTLPYDPTWQALAWAKKHCASYITNDVHKDEYNMYDHKKIDYYFSDEREALLFALVWL